MGGDTEYGCAVVFDFSINGIYNEYKDTGLVEGVIEELKRINSTLSGILEVMRKPEKTKIMQVFEVAGASVGILGIISIADIIRKWITGG